MRNSFSACLLLLLSFTFNVAFISRAEAAAVGLQEGAVGTVDPTLKASSDAERKAWNKVAGEEDLKKKAEAAEDYLKDFAAGVYAPYAHEIVAVYARQSNDLPKFFEHGELAVASLPESLMLEVGLAVAYAEQQKPEPALKHGERALTVLPTLVAAQGEEGTVTEEHRRAMLADANYAVGTAHLFRGFNAKDRMEIADALTFLEAAVAQSPKDERCQFRLAFGYMITRQSDKAVNGFARTVALEGPNVRMARQYLEQAYKAKNGSLDGLEALIIEQKTLLELEP